MSKTRNLGRIKTPMQAGLPGMAARVVVTSPDFEEGQFIPTQYTCDGANINPQLDIAGVPEGAVSLAIIVDDPDAPIRTWVHWVAWNIPVTGHIREARVMEEEGMNDMHQRNYSGPCPHSGLHHYHFKVFALDKLLSLPPRATRFDLEKAMAGHILGFGELVGVYERK